MTDEPELPVLLPFPFPRRRPSSVHGFEALLRALERPRKLTRRREVRERIQRNARRRALWLSLSRKKERERDVRWQFIGHSPYFGWDGWPISLRTYCFLSQESRFDGRRGGKHVAVTKALDDPETWVSTVWLGLDHSWSGGPPLIFETMIFGGPLDQDYQQRYSTVEEARAGHERAVEVARSGQRPEDDDETESRPVINQFINLLADAKAAKAEPAAPDAVDEVADAVGLGRQDTLDVMGVEDPKKS